jgi:superfamily II DNA/RNA helicase
MKWLKLFTTVSKKKKSFRNYRNYSNQMVFLENGEKLVIFTEHKDTLLYLEERLSKSGGYKVATIHGGKNVDDRREAQWAFAKPDTQILIATDAAGEGINLQFCRLLNQLGYSLESKSIRTTNGKNTPLRPKTRCIGV